MVREFIKELDIATPWFRQIRSSGQYYVDKTKLIKRILDTDPRGVFLIARPRRFGKTTNLTMLEAFFDCEHEDDGSFDGLEISDHPEYDGYRRAHPVLLLDLYYIRGYDFEDLLGSLSYSVESAMWDHREIMEDGLMPNEREISDRLLKNRESFYDILRLVPMFCEAAYRRYGSDTVILIDNYDTAISRYLEDGIDQRAVRLLRMFIKAAIWDNPHCQLAVLAGNMPSGIAGPYEGLRKMWSDDVLDTMFADCFGFTVPETRAMMEHFGHPELSDEVLSVYGGYRFGGMEMCDPGGVARFIYADFSYDSLRREFSRNIPMRYAMTREGAIGPRAFADLLVGSHIISELNEAMACENMDPQDPRDLFTLLVMTGYLRAERRDDGRFDISVTNGEMIDIVDSMFVSYPTDKSKRLVWGGKEMGDTLESKIITKICRVWSRSPIEICAGLGFGGMDRGVMETLLRLAGSGWLELRLSYQLQDVSVGDHPDDLPLPGHEHRTAAPHQRSDRGDRRGVGHHRIRLAHDIGDDHHTQLLHGGPLPEQLQDPPLGDAAH